MNKKSFMYFSIAVLIVTIISSTLALVYYRSEETNVTLKVSNELGEFINYKNGTPVLGTENDILNAGTSYLDGISTEIELWKTENAKNMDIYGHIYLDLNTISYILASDLGFKWAVTTNGILISEGNFTNYKQGDSVPILINQKLLPSITKFKIYIWLDENELSSSNISGETFTLTVRCEATSEEYPSLGGNSSFEDEIILEEHGFDYTGEVQTLSINQNGTYKLEVWGAQGGTANNYRGGYGGYSKGIANLTEGNLYIYVGGQGNSGYPNNAIAGGYNGGGSVSGGSGTNRYVASGGGATHIAIKDGLLNTLSNNIDDILIVAGGGGGGYQHTSVGYYGLGGNGGGYLGVNGEKGTSGGNHYGTGGSQTAAGFAYNNSSYGQGGFGFGGVVGSGTHGSSGGGGFYGGGGSAGIAGQSNSSGGGGSGYIANSLLSNKAMYCFGCIVSNDADTLTYDVTDVSETPTKEYAKMGNGYAKVTMILNPNVITRKVINYGTDYDFKVEESIKFGDDYNVIYSTYENASTLSIGEYQIKFILKNNITGTEYTYYQKVEIIGG